jgi:hypothetical protein
MKGTNNMLTKKKGFFALFGVFALAMSLFAMTSFSRNAELLHASEGDTVVYSTGFEASEGFEASTSYSNTGEKEQGPEDGKWGVIMGSASTTGPLFGSQSMQMRSYAGNFTIGRVYPKWSFENLTKVTFQAKANADGGTITVEYSLDNSTWSLMDLAGTYNTTTSLMTASMPEGLSGNQEEVYFRINHTLTDDANRCTIDDVEVYAVITFGELQSIEVASMPVKTEYFVGEFFTDSGLTLTGYDEDENTILITSGFTTDYDDHRFIADDIGTVEVTVTYETKTTTFEVEVEAVPVAEKILYLDGDDFNTTSYAANNGPHLKDSVDELAQIGYFTNQIMKNSTTGRIQAKSDTGYIYNTSDFDEIDSIIIIADMSGDFSTNNLTVREGSLIKPHDGDIVEPLVDEDGLIFTYEFSEGNGFFYMSNGGYTTYLYNIIVIPKLAVDHANQFANDFLDATDAICEADGSTNFAALESTWNDFSAAYATLSADAKDYIVHLSTSGDVESALERYEFILNKYAFADNFIEDSSGDPLFSVGSVLNTENIAVNSVSVLVILSIAIIVSAGGFYTYSAKKKIRV